MKDAIGYLRVSTKEQGRSGLGLDAQRKDIEGFSEREGFAIKAWHKDIQTGAGKDALLLRPGLATALKEARAVGAPLIVSRLDRLSRNVHFISGLMEHKVHFIIAAFGKDVDDFVIHIYASLAQQERKMIAERIKAAIAIAKANGRKFTLQTCSKAMKRRIREASVTARKKAATERLEAHRPHIEWAFRQQSRYGAYRPLSFNEAAAKLNERGIESLTSGRWTGSGLARAARRLGLDPTPGQFSQDVVRAKVREVWNANPGITGRELMAHWPLPHPIGFLNCYRFLTECRLSAARRSPLHRKIGWRIDERTVTRIQIARIVNKHPALTALEVLERLGPGRYRSAKWVGYVVEECRNPSALKTHRRWNRSHRAKQKNGTARKHEAAALVTVRQATIRSYCASRDEAGRLTTVR
jgi:DNA invertase Pin-like site-specific DNA recombinase